MENAMTTNQRRSPFAPQEGDGVNGWVPQERRAFRASPFAEDNAAETLTHHEPQGVLFSASQARLLVVDDDPLVRETFALILADVGYEVDSVGSSAEGLRLLDTGAYDIALCDVFMPGENGLAFVQQMRNRHPEIPVVLITAHGNMGLARQALSLGAADFVTKNGSPLDLPIIIERNLARRAFNMQQNLQNKITLHATNENVLSALLSALNTRDTETQGHSERVTAFTLELAERMQRDDEELYHIERGAPLHDIGKIGIPDRILLKPDKLTAEEWVEMKKQPVIGYEMCARIGTLQQASQIVLHHHEAWDGMGYPHGLRKDEIPLGARIFAIADTLDAMTSDRPYRNALPITVAREEIAKFAGRQFDPDVVDIFLDVPEERWMHIRQLSKE